MAQTVTISTKELKRQAGLVFEGKTLKAMLCNMTTIAYTEESTVANWQTIEVTGTGYVRHSGVIPVGAYDQTLGAYVIPDMVIDFTCTIPYSYNKVVLYIDGETYVHSIITELPNITLAAGQTQTYVIKLRQDD